MCVGVGGGGGGGGGWGDATMSILLKLLGEKRLWHLQQAIRSRVVVVFCG